MKQTTVLKALNSMDEKRVSEFLSDDLRNFGEIIEAVCDEVEVGYVEFMHELIQKCKTIEAEEKSIVAGNLSKCLVDDNYVLLKKNGSLILTDEQSKKLYESVKNLPIQSMFNIPKMDLSNLVMRRRDDNERCKNDFK